MAFSFEGRLRRPASGLRFLGQEAPPLASLPDGTEVKGAEGSFCLIRRLYPGHLRLPTVDPDRLKRNLQLLHGVGPKTAERLRLLGFGSLEDLLVHGRWAAQARQVLAAIEEKKVRRLRARGAGDRDLLAFFGPEDLVFMDLETTGLSPSLPLFLVGLLYAEEEGLVLLQFLARRFEEERAVLAAVAAELPRFKVIVTYNGRRFDLPYLRGRFLFHRLPYRWEGHLFLDLLRHARRRYRGWLPDCRLVTVETAFCARPPRVDDVPGMMVPELYHEFVRTQDPALIEAVLAHNAMDLLALAELIRLVED
ncbi:MAG: ribonuclease H-like domain-containing protein [Bacillota bacterium]